MNTVQYVDELCIIPMQVYKDSHFTFNVEKVRILVIGSSNLRTNTTSSVSSGLYELIDSPERVGIETISSESVFLVVIIARWFDGLCARLTCQHDTLAHRAPSLAEKRIVTHEVLRLGIGLAV